jgi:hypothetical protein
MTAKEFNQLSETDKTNLVGLRNEIYTKVLRNGRRIDRLYKLHDFYVEYNVSPQEGIYLINALEMDAQALQTWKSLREEAYKLINPVL